MKMKWTNRINNQGQLGINMFLTTFIVVIGVSVLLPAFYTISLSVNEDIAGGFLSSQGYIVLAEGEYNTINDKLDAIKLAADTAVENAEAAVTAAENAVDAAELAADKVDLFNSAEVFLFPNVTNVTVTFTAGNTNVWSDWVEVVDSLAVTLSSKFAAAAGYINDMYVFDHSAVDKIYCIELAYGAAKTTLGRMMWHTSYKDTVQIKSRRVPAGSTIYYRMMCSGANAATAKVGFRYFFE